MIFSANFAQEGISHKIRRFSNMLDWNSLGISRTNETLKRKFEKLISSCIFSTVFFSTSSRCVTSEVYSISKIIHTSALLKYFYCVWIPYIEPRESSEVTVDIRGIQVPVCHGGGCLRNKVFDVLCQRIFSCKCKDQDFTEHANRADFFTWDRCGIRLHGSWMLLAPLLHLMPSGIAISDRVPPGLWKSVESY